MPRNVILVVVVLLAAVTGAVLMWQRSVAPTATVAVPTATGTTAWDPMNPVNIAKRERVDTLVERARAKTLTQAESQELCSLVRHDPAFNIRVRAMAALPFMAEREQAVDVLIEALNDRDPQRSGAGNVQLYATTYLAEMKAARAVPAIEEWLQFLDAQKPYAQEVLDALSEKGKRNLASLRADAGR